MSYQRGGMRMNRPYGGGGYGNHPPSGYHQGQNTSYTQPAYSTQSNYGSNKLIGDPRGGYQSNQQQQQQPPQKPPQQQVQPAPLQQPPTPPMLKDTPTPVPVPVPPPPQQQPDPKQETEEKNNDSSMDASDETVTATPGSRGPKYRPWNKRGGSGIKITRKMRKRRQNARLRNLLAPKNAMMVLHELHPELKMVISEQVNAANQTAYTVEIEVEGKIYRGHGMSKMSAKQAASENALKEVLLEKLQQNNLKINPDNTLGSEGSAPPPDSTADVPMKEEGTAESNDGEEDSSTSVPSNPAKRPVEDDVPWGSLASFALFKLFAEWQSQGFQLPPSGLPPVFHKSSGVKKIPEDANKKHPVQLLNQIRPGSQYSESREGTPPNLTFKFTVVIDGQTFHGVGSNKKDAKKECAKHALEALGVKYE